MRKAVESWPVLRLIKDVTLCPKILPKKAKNAIKKYGDRSLQPDDVLLIIDNTIFRSAKQGMFLTEDTLYAFSEYSGKFSIKLAEIKTLEPKLERPLKIPLIGMTVNDKYFISLPGLNEMVEQGEDSVPAILLLAVFFSENLSCEIIGGD